MMKRARDLKEEKVSSLGGGNKRGRDTQMEEVKGEDKRVRCTRVEFDKNVVEERQSVELPTSGTQCTTT